MGGLENPISHTTLGVLNYILIKDDNNDSTNSRIKQCWDHTTDRGVNSKNVGKKANREIQGAPITFREGDEEPADRSSFC